MLPFDDVIMYQFFRGTPGILRKKSCHAVASCVITALSHMIQSDLVTTRSVIQHDAITCTRSWIHSWHPKLNLAAICFALIMILRTQWSYSLARGMSKIMTSLDHRIIIVYERATCISWRFGLRAQNHLWNGHRKIFVRNWIAVVVKKSVSCNSWLFIFLFCFVFVFFIQNISQSLLPPKWSNRADS